MSLHVASLTLSHFRSHRVARLRLDARPVAIHGANGSGKTNLIEAISLLSAGRGLRRAAAADMTRRPEALGWKLTAEVIRDGETIEVKTWSDAGAARQVRIDSKAASQLDLAERIRVLWLIPAMDRLWIEGAEGRRRFLDRAAMSLFPDHATATLAYEKAMRERNRLLKEQVRDAHWYRALERQMAESGAAVHSHRMATLDALRTAQQDATTAFPAAELSLEPIEGDLPETAEDLADALEESRFRDLAAGRTLVGPHRADLSGRYAAKDVPARDCSTGEQKALLLSLILSNARALKARIGTPPLLLLDEVAAHLDANRRAALYDEVCALGAQAWMTGTGPDLFEDLGDRAQRLLVEDEDGVSTVTVE
ncbi:DNA replication/repair protein RecF [Pseudaestuariivita atlantica]|uniref:DNA replication and repair protein RecF n=1 Tax=Pseudaestuariivita atlantica TaxID=1317121 RepID=A0A0L1JQM2_9RHOB|nr:DNA replication/repair protein RecF [Pseudaestuariivita atlantica]KNG93718.1 recombinase RecF [Pseudaestuariivita atlantica]